MKNIWCKIKENYRFDYLLFFVLGLISLTWFKGDNYISGGTFTWHVDFHEYLNTALYVWERMVSAGYSLVRMPALLFPYIVYGSIFQTIFGNSLVYEKALFYLCFSASGVSTYFLLKTLGLKRVPRILGSLFYMLNPFASVVVWYLSIGLFFPFYSFFPLAVALFIKVLEGKVNFILANLIIFLLPIGTSFANPAFFLLLYFTLFLYAGFILGRNLLSKNYKEFRRTIFLFLKFSGLLFLLNIFWILPFITDITNQYEAASNVRIGLAGDLSTIKLNSVKFFEAFRLLGLWSFKSQFKGDLYYPWHIILSSPLFVVFSYVPGIVVILGFWSTRRNRERVKLFWFFLFLLGLILISGLYFPLSSFWEFIYEGFPYILRAFRGGYTKFGFLYVLAFTIVFSFGADTLSKKFGSKVLLLAIPIFLLGFPFFEGSVVYQGGKYLKPYLTKVPSDYFLFKDWDKVNKTDGRYLVFPISGSYNFSFNWEDGYQGADYLRQFSTKPILSVNNPNIMSLLVQLIDKGEVSVPIRLSSLMNVQKMIFRDDVSWLLPESLLTGDQEKIKLFLNNLELEKEIGIFKVFDLGHTAVLPHFYVPRETIYLYGNDKDLANVVSFNNYDLRSGIFLDSDGNDTRVVEENISNKHPVLDGADSVFSVGKGKGTLFSVRELGLDKDRLLFPDASVNPSDWKYFLVRIKEFFEESRAKSSLEKADVLLWLSVKRISEMDIYDVPEDLRNKLVSRYLEGIKKSIDVFMSVPDRDWDGNYWVQAVKTLMYMEKSNEILLANGYDFKDPKNPQTIHDSFRSWLDEYINLSCGEFCYDIEVPRSGDYEIFIDKREIGKLESVVDIEDVLSSVKLHFVGGIGKTVSSEINTEEEGWYRLGRLHLNEGQKYRVDLNLPDPENLLGSGDWLEPGISGVEDYEVDFLYQSAIPGYEDTSLRDKSGAVIGTRIVLWSSSIRYKPVEGWNSGEEYKISFDYSTDQGRFGVSLVEEVTDYSSIYGHEGFDTSSEGSSLPTVKRLLFNEDVRSVRDTPGTRISGFVGSEDTEFCNYYKYKDEKCYRDFEKIVQAGPDAKRAFLYIYARPDPDRFSDIKVRDLKVQSFLNPRIVLRKVGEVKEEKPVPRVTFTRVNATKYKVEIEEAKEPYTLIFSEGFHPGWKVYIDGTIDESEANLKTFGSWLVGRMGNIGRDAISLFLQDGDRGDIVADYFDGEVKEGTHRDIFLEPSTFETWGKKPIFENRHLMVNGYANSWHITPEDVGGKENYELIVEFSPQRAFYLGLFASGLAFFGCSGFLIYKGLRGLKLGERFIEIEIEKE